MSNATADLYFFNCYIQLVINALANRHTIVCIQIIWQTGRQQLGIWLVCGHMSSECMSGWMGWWVTIIMK